MCNEKHEINVTARSVTHNPSVVNATATHQQRSVCNGQIGKKEKICHMYEQTGSVLVRAYTRERK